MIRIMVRRMTATGVDGISVDRRGDGICGATRILVNVLSTIQRCTPIMLRREIGSAVASSVRSCHQRLRGAGCHRDLTRRGTLGCIERADWRGPPSALSATRARMWASEKFLTRFMTVVLP